MKYLPLIALICYTATALLECYRPHFATAPVFSISYAIVVAPNISAQDIIEIRRAADSWQDAVGGLAVAVLQRGCEPQTPHESCLSLADPSTIERMGCPLGSVGCTTRYPNTDASIIRMLPSLSGDELFRVAAHEMGHAFGIHEHGHKGEIMAPSMGDQPMNVTCADARRFWAVRGLEIEVCR